MALFATFVTAPYRDGNGHGSRNYAMMGMAENSSVAASRTMARLVETSPAGREYGSRPLTASHEVAAWQLREAQQPGRGLYMVGIASSSPTPGIGDSWNVSARVVVATDADSARKSALAEFSRQSPGARVVDAMTVTASRDVVSRALKEWDRERGYRQDAAPRSPAVTQETARQERSPSSRQAGFNVRDYAQKVIDTYRANVRYVEDKGAAIMKTIHAHAERLSSQNLASFSDAGRVADAAIKSYQRAQASGVDHLKAREQVGREMASRFDDRGRSVERRGRGEEQGLSR